MQSNPQGCHAYGTQSKEIFSKDKSDNRKTHGMAAAAQASPDLLDLARDIARELCRISGSCTADDVGQILSNFHGIHSMGPAAGSLFKHPDFKPTGQLRKSIRKKNHARLIYVWQLSQEV